MDEKQIQFLWDNYASKGKGFKDISEFKDLMSNDSSRKTFFDFSNKDLGFNDYSEFESIIGVKKKDQRILPESGTGLKSSQPPIKKAGKFVYNPQSFSQSIKALQEYNKGKTKDIQDFADPRLNQLWQQSKQKASEAGVDPVADFAVAALDVAGDLVPTRIKNSWDRGAVQGKQAAIIGTAENQLTPEQISELSLLERQALEIPESEEAKKFNEGGFSWMFKNPIQGAKFIGETLASSLSARLAASKRTIPASVATGAAVGSIVPGVGTLAGGATGLTAGFVTSALSLETSQKVLDSLRAAGFDVSDEEALKKGFANRDLIEKAREQGLKRGVPIMIMDLVSAGLGSTILAGTGSKLARTTGALAVQSGGGAGGEFLAQVSAGEKIRPRDIALEAIAEIGSGAPALVTATASRVVSRNKTSASNENIAKSIAIDPKDGANDALRNLDNQLQEGRITEEDYQEGVEFVKKSEKAKDKIPADLDDNVKAESIVLVDKKDNLVNDISELEKQKETLDDAFHKPIDDQIIEKQKQLDDINTQIQDAVKTGKTKLEAELDVFVNKIKGGEKLTSPEDLQFYENNKTEIESILKEDAVQEQAAGQVPVQPETEISGEVAQGEPQAEPKEVAEGVQEEVDVEREKAFVLMDKIDADVRKRQGVGPQTKTKALDKKLYESTTNALQQTSWYQQADDTARENAMRELASRYGVRIKRTPSAEKILSKEPKMILVDEYKELTRKIKMKDVATRKGIKMGVEMTKEQQRALDDITQGLRDEIKIQLDEAKAAVFKGRDIGGTVAQRIMSKINKAKTPIQLLSAVDYLKRSIDDIDYANKVDDSKSLASKTKKLVSNAPLNIKQAITNLANSSPKESADLEAFNKAMSSAYEFLRQKDYTKGINEEEINNLAEKIIKSNLKRKLEDAIDLLARKNVPDADIAAIEKSREEQLKTAETKEQQKEINRIYDQQIEDLVDKERGKIEKPVSESIKDMQNALDEYNDLLKPASEQAILSDVGQKDGRNREALEAINDILRIDLEDVDVDQLTDKQKDLVEALQNIDIDRLTDKQLKFLNYAINNFVENGRFDGVGQYIYNEYKIQRNFTPENIDEIKAKVIRMNDFKRASFSRTSLDSFLNSVLANEKFVAKFRNITGLGDWSNDYGSKDKFKGRIKKDLSEILKIAQDTKIIDSRESQIKLGSIADIVQHENGLTPDEIQAEFLGRKEAMAESVKRGLEAIDKNSEKYVEVWAEENEPYVKAVAEVYEKYIKNANTPDELTAKLNSGEKKLWEAMRDKWESIKERQRELSEINKNEVFDDLINYHARTYIPLYETKVDTKANTGFINLANAAALRVREKIDRTKSTAFKDRVLKGAQIRENHILNYNILDSFQNEYRKQLYDYFTFEDRQYVVQALSSKDIRKALNNDLEVLNYVQRSYSNRYANEVEGLQAARETGLLDDILKSVNSSVVRDALGGFVVPFVKQVAPSTASALVNAPSEWMSSIYQATRNNKDFIRLLNQAPVSMRHDQEVAMTGGLIASKDLKETANLLKKKLRAFNDISDSVLMKSLKVGDQSTAGWNWLAYYQKYLLDRGVIKSLDDFDIKKEADSPNKEAIQYAEQMTATTLNINEAVNRPENITIPIIGKYMPFTSFAMNSKINLMNNIGKVFESNGVMSLEEKVAAARRIGSHVAESVAINYVSMLMRGAAIGGAATLFSYALKQSNLTEEEKDKAILILQNTFSDLIESNDKNSVNYLINDLTFGQIGENFFAPITGAIYDAVVNFNKSIQGKQMDTPDYVSAAEHYSAIATIIGYPGIYIVKLGKGINNASELVTHYNDPLFRLNKFGYINAYGNKVIPFEKQTTEVPAFNKYMQTVSVLSNLASLSSGTPNEIQNFTRRIPQINKRLITGLYGRDNRLLDEKERYSALETIEVDGKKYYLKDEFSIVSEGIYDYVLNTDQLEERKKFKEEYLNATYNSMMKTGVKAYTELRKNFEALAKKDPNNKVYQKVLENYKYAGRFQDANILAAANEVSKLKILSKYSKNGKVALKLKNEIEKK